jgi:hypothetical protein
MKVYALKGENTFDDTQTTNTLTPEPIVAKLRDTARNLAYGRFL